MARGAADTERRTVRRRGGIGMRRTAEVAGVPAGRQSGAELHAPRSSSSSGTSGCPAPRKALLAGALGYLVLGRDIIPDDIPIIGGLDDLVVVVLAVDLFLEGVPAEVLHEKLDLLGIDRASYERDMAQVRRLMPGPVRRGMRRIPRRSSARRRKAVESRRRPARSGTGSTGRVQSREGDPDGRRVRRSARAAR